MWLLNYTVKEHQNMDSYDLHSTRFDGCSTQCACRSACTPSECNLGSNFGTDISHLLPQKLSAGVDERTGIRQDNAGSALITLN